MFSYCFRDFFSDGFQQGDRGDVKKLSELQLHLFQTSCITTYGQAGELFLAWRGVFELSCVFKPWCHHQLPAQQVFLLELVLSQLVSLLVLVPVLVPVLASQLLVSPPFSPWFPAYRQCLQP